MEARLKLKPGQNGTKKLLARFGERLVCVRYRYDESRALRFTTVELIVSQSAWYPRKRARAVPRSALDMVCVRIAYDDIALRAKMKTLGALWRPRHKLWELPWGAVQALGIEHASYPIWKTNRSSGYLQSKICSNTYASLSLYTNI